MQFGDLVQKLPFKTNSSAEFLSILDTITKKTADFLQDHSTHQNILFYTVQIPDENCSLTCTDAVIRKKLININQIDSTMRQTALFYASRTGHVSVVDYLLKNGANASIRDVVQQTALFYAAREGHHLILELLAKSSNSGPQALVNAIDSRGQSALFYAARENRLTASKTLVEKLSANPMIRDLSRRKPIDFCTQTLSTPFKKSDKADKLSETGLFLLSLEQNAEDHNVHALSTSSAESDNKLTANPHPNAYSMLHYHNFEKKDSSREEWYNVAYYLINYTLISHPDSWLFMDPVSDFRANDYKYIFPDTSKLCISQIGANLDSDKYLSFEDVVTDLLRVISNALVYNCYSHNLSSTTLSFYSYVEEQISIGLNFLVT